MEHLIKSWKGFHKITTNYRQNLPRGPTSNNLENILLQDKTKTSNVVYKLYHNKMKAPKVKKFTLLDLLEDEELPQEFEEIKYEIKNENIAQSMSLKRSFSEKEMEEITGERNPPKITVGQFINYCDNKYTSLDVNAEDVFTKWLKKEAEINKGKLVRPYFELLTPPEIIASLFLDKFRSPLNIVGQMDGITRPSMQIGSSMASSVLHLEDCGFGTINYCVKGRNLWVIIDPACNKKLENKIGQLLKIPQKERHCFMRRKTYRISTKQLDDWDIKYRIIIQEEEDIIVLGVGVYHQVTKLESSINISWNYMPFLEPEEIKLLNSFGPCECFSNADAKKQRKDDDEKVKKSKIEEILVNPAFNAICAQSEDDFLATKSPHCQYFPVFFHRAEEIIKLFNAEEKKLKEKFTCRDNKCGCGHPFSCQKTLNEHLDRFEQSQTNLPTKCPKKNCSSSFKIKSDLRTHLNKVHKKRMSKGENSDDSD